jgi:hypothetical protein
LASEENTVEQVRPPSTGLRPIEPHLALPHPEQYKGIILSLCEESGAWSGPYVEQGYAVIRVDPKFGEWRSLYKDRGMTDRMCGNGSLMPMPDGGFGLSYSVQALANILLSVPDYFGVLPVVGVMMAPPCTDFTVSCNRFWKQKDADGRTAVSVSIVNACLFIKDRLKPTWWVLENPVGRIARMCPDVGKWRLVFNPCDYAGWADEPDHEAYTKRTCLWGDFNPDLEKRPREPVFYTDKKGRRLSWLAAKLGGKSERTKELRSKTPVGFSRAFAKANP